MQGGRADPGEARGTLTGTRAAPSARSGCSRPGIGSDAAWGRSPIPVQGLSPTWRG
jgi:hypothetical protein